VLLLPIVFPAIMAVGAFAGGAGLPMPGVELGIAASVVALGLLVAFGVRMPLAAGAGLVGLFALLHGHSHGTEMSMAASPAGYALGFLCATPILHAFLTAEAQPRHPLSRCNWGRMRLQNDHSLHSLGWAYRS
jgi:urease accessory protein